MAKGYSLSTVRNALKKGEKRKAFSAKRFVQSV